MTKEEILKEVRKRVAEKLPKKLWAKEEVIRGTVDELLSLITEEVLKGNKVSLRNFGTFYLKERAARPARNPKTGEKISLPARKRFYFKPASRIRFVEE